MSTQQLILTGVAIYFVIGAFIAHGITALSMGFAGRFEPMAIAAFFGWPIFLLLRILGPWALALPWLAAAAAIVSIVYFAMRSL